MRWGGSGELLPQALRRTNTFINAQILVRENQRPASSACNCFVRIEYQFLYVICAVCVSVELPDTNSRRRILLLLLWYIHGCIRSAGICSTLIFYTRGLTNVLWKVAGWRRRRKSEAADVGKCCFWWSVCLAYTPKWWNQLNTICVNTQLRIALWMYGIFSCGHFVAWEFV